MRRSPNSRASISAELARRDDRAHRRPRRYGRRATPRGDAERRRRALHRGGPARRAPRRHSLPRRAADDLDDASRLADAAIAARRRSASAVRQRGRGAPELLGARLPPRRRHRPDQRPRSDQLRPPNCRWRRPSLRARSRRVRAPLARGDGRHVEAMVEWQRRGAVVFDYGNNLRAGRTRRLRATPSPTLASSPPTSARSSARARGHSAGSRSPATRRTSPHRRRVLASSPRRVPRRWIRLAGERVAFQGLPARICWLGYGERHGRAGVQRMVRDGELRRRS